LKPRRTTARGGSLAEVRVGNGVGVAGISAHAPPAGLTQGPVAGHLATPPRPTDRQPRPITLAARSEKIRQLPAADALNASPCSPATLAPAIQRLASTSPAGPCSLLTKELCVGAPLVRAHRPCVGSSKDRVALLELQEAGEIQSAPFPESICALSLWLDRTLDPPTAQQSAITAHTWLLTEL